MDGEVPMAVSRQRVLVPLLLAAATAAAQGGPATQGEAVIEIPADLPMPDLLDRIAAETGRPLLYDPNGQRIRGQTAGVPLSRAVPKDRLFDTYRAILAFYELTLVPVGPLGHEVYLVQDARSSNSTVKNKAQFVKPEELESLADRDGLMVSCAIPVRHIANLTYLRSALSSIVTPAGIGRVMEVPDGRALVVQDFAPTVAAVARLIRQMDVPDRGRAWTMDLIRLEHAWAPDLAEVLTEVLQRESPPRPPNAPGPPAPPAPKVRAYERLNALAVGAAADEMALVRALVAQLDTPAPEEAGIEVVPVAHRPAEDVAAALAARGASAIVHPGANALLLPGPRPERERLARLVRLFDRPRI
jgi:hypothetical protein